MGLFNFGVFDKYNFKAWLSPFDISNVHHSCLGNNVLVMLKNTTLSFVDKIYKVVNSASSFAGVGRVVVYSRGRYIVGTLSNGIFYTDDNGATFNASTWPVGVGSLVYGMAANESVVCAMGGVGMRYSIDNGASFTPSAVVNPAPIAMTSSTRSPNCLKWLPEVGLFVYVGGNAGGGRIGVSVDGNNWQLFVYPTVPAAKAFQTVAYFRDKIYVAGISGTVYQLNTDFTGLIEVDSATGTPIPNSFNSSDLFVFNDQLYLVTGNDGVTVTGSISVLGGSGFNMLYTPQGSNSPLFTAHAFNGALHVVGRGSFVRTDAQLPV